MDFKSMSIEELQEFMATQQKEKQKAQDLKREASKALNKKILSTPMAKAEAKLTAAEEEIVRLKVGEE